MKIKIQCPSKINLTLKVFKKNEITGFHPIESIMQTISLYDFITVEKTANGINFAGNSNEIPYDKTNLIIKACEAFFNKSKIKSGLDIYLEKNIPVSAGLAGGSTDAAGIILGLNTIFNNPLSEKEIFEINSSLGSDINFCYKGGRAFACGKGDDITPLDFEEFSVMVVAFKDLKIRAKTAYDFFDKLEIVSNLPNDLEFALLPEFKELKELSLKGFQMSGSGSAFFMINPENKKIDLDRKKYKIFENLKSVPYGVKPV